MTTPGDIDNSEGIAQACGDELIRRLLEEEHLCEQADHRRDEVECRRANDVIAAICEELSGRANGRIVVYRDKIKQRDFYFRFDDEWYEMVEVIPAGWLVSRRPHVADAVVDVNDHSHDVLETFDGLRALLTRLENFWSHHD